MYGMWELFDHVPAWRVVTSPETPVRRRRPMHGMRPVYRGLPSRCHHRAMTDSNNIHPIEVESYQILAQRVDLSNRPESHRKFIERMIHATADESYADSARVGDGAPAALLSALQTDAPVVVDASMVRAGITKYETLCFLDRVRVAPAGSTRSAKAFELAAKEFPDGAVFVVGNAPTALFELLRLADAGLVRPRAVVGVPVGFVGAKESKAALWESRLAAISITNMGERGGTPVAAAIVNAAVRQASATS